MLQRNRELPGHWLAVKCFAHYATTLGGLSMPEAEFRRSVFGFFLPGGAAPRMALKAAAHRTRMALKAAAAHLADYARTF